jgi:hypothetical protein
VRDTSLLAWQEIQPKLGKQQQLALDAIKKYPDHTYNELAQPELSGMGESLRKRASELEDKKLIKSVGKRKCTVTGYECHIWRATQ